MTHDNIIRKTGNNLEKNYENGIVISMTVCIVALADNGKKAVLVADKLGTTKGVLPYQIEMATSKIFKINDNVNVMYCGGVADATIVIERVKKHIGQNKWAEDIANLVNNKYLEYLMEILEREHLTTRGIKSITEYYKEYSIKLDDLTKTKIDDALTKGTLNSQTQFIVCGKDSSGLYKVYYLGSNPRIIPQLNISGYSTIGSGGNYANFSMLHDKYDSSLKKEEVETILKNAKKEAEKDRDVGSQEDIIIME